MKKKTLSKKLIVICLLCILSIILYVSYMIYTFIGNPFIRYSSPKEAVLQAKLLKCDEIYGVIEKNNVAVVIYESEGSLTDKMLFKDEKGWKQPPLNYNNRISLKLKDHKIAELLKYNNKYYLNFSTFTREKIATVEDSIGNIYKKDFELSYGITNTLSQHWLIELDELPKDYSIIVYGETLKIT